MVKPASARALKADAEQLYQTHGESAVFDAYIDAAFKAAKSSPLPHYTVSAYFEQYNTGLRKKLNLKKQRRERIEGDELHAVTQFFTPRHLAEYLTDNSLGRLLKKAGLSFNLPYLDDDTNTTLRLSKGKADPPPLNHNPQNLTIKLEDIRIFDPACGTGNMLFYAYQLLYDAYKSQGLSITQIKQRIKDNIIGFDVDPRAAAVARRIFSQVFGSEITILDASFSPILLEALKPCSSLYEWVQFLPERGSLSPKLTKHQLSFLSQINMPSFQEEILNIIKLNQVFSSRYDIILVNPPYLSSADYGHSLKAFIWENYLNYKADLFSVFIARAMEWRKEGGYIGVVCPYNWMFIKQFEYLREKILKKCDIINLAMLPPSGYRSAVVYLSAFVLGDNKNGKGKYLRLSQFDDPTAAIKTAKRYTINKERFARTPYNALIFWTSEQFIANYKQDKLSDYLTIRQGMATGNNAKYLKKIEDVSPKDIAFDATSIEDFNAKNKQYALYNKGGEYRKWYGNINYVIRFNSASREELARQGNNMPSRQYYFKPCITWTLVSSKGYFGARISNNSVFDVGGSCGFPKDPSDIYVLLAYLCSNVASYYLNAHNPTLNCQVGDIKNLPYIPPAPEDRAVIQKLTKENIEIAKADWEGMLKKEECQAAFEKTKANEERLNKIFNRIYGLDGEVSPLVPDRLITLKNKGE
ncbi:MAG: N-6 DNA methylase [Clostridia bacterium]